MNLFDWIILACLVILLFFAARHSYRHRNDECDGSCSACPYHAQCTKKQKK